MKNTTPAAEAKMFGLSAASRRIALNTLKKRVRRRGE